MTNYEFEKEERQMEREIREFKKVEKERKLRKEFAETLQSPNLKKMVLDTICENPYLFELPDTKANANLNYYNHWRTDSEKGDIK